VSKAKSSFGTKPKCSELDPGEACLPLPKTAPASISFARRTAALTGTGPTRSLSLAPGPTGTLPFLLSRALSLSLSPSHRPARARALLPSPPTHQQGNKIPSRRSEPRYIPSTRPSTAAHNLLPRPRPPHVRQRQEDETLPRRRHRGHPRLRLVQVGRRASAPPHSSHAPSSVYSRRRPSVCTRVVGVVARDAPRPLVGEARTPSSCGLGTRGGGGPRPCGSSARGGHPVSRRRGGGLRAAAVGFGSQRALSLAASFRLDRLLIILASLAASRCPVLLI
jgi:hypothetical protein